jgi:hypothetical protein
MRVAQLEKNNRYQPFRKSKITGNGFMGVFSINLVCHVSYCWSVKITGLQLLVCFQFTVESATLIVANAYVESGFAY